MSKIGTATPAAWATTTSATPGVVNMSAPRDHLAEARAQEQGLNAARRRLRDAARGAGILFGPSVEHALTVPLNDVLDHHSLIVVSFEEAVDAAARKITSAQATLVQEQAASERRIDGLKAECDRLRELLAKEQRKVKAVRARFQAGA